MMVRYTRDSLPDRHTMLDLLVQARYRGTVTAPLRGELTAEYLVDPEGWVVQALYTGTQLDSLTARFAEIYCKSRRQYNRELHKRRPHV